MRPPRVRFTIRLLMILIAIVAIVIGAERVRQRSALCRVKAAGMTIMEEFARSSAETHAAEVAHYRKKVAKSQKSIDSGDGDPETQQFWRGMIDLDMQRIAFHSEEAKGWLLRAARYARLRNAYHLAATRPWIFVETNPDASELE